MLFCFDERFDRPTCDLPKSGPDAAPSGGLKR